MADWFTDADVQAVAELMVTQHAYLDVAKMLHWRDYEPEARAVLTTLGPRIAQVWAEGFKQGGPMHDSDYDDPDKHTRNPYREADGSA